MNLKNYKDDLLKELQDPEYASEYLAQALETGDQPTFLLALRDVVEAVGGATVVAKQAKIQRESLYKVLSDRGKLGEVAHVSPLLRKAIDVSGCLEERVGEWLLKCAVLRGANHYARDFGPDLPDDNQRLGDEEVGVALCLGNHPYNSAFIRAAAQLLSSDRIDPVRLTRLAVMERVETVFLHVASVAGRFEPTAEPWVYLREHLRERNANPRETLPHWSRFVSQTGVTPFGGGPDIKWLWRGKPRT